MIYSNKKLSQIIVESCVVYQVEHIVISPGSRNAPLIIGFTNHPKIKTYSIVDERSAAFFALGIAQQTRKPAAVVCTSGSALLNYYPAIVEAFYSDIPLIVISADRPKHLIDVGDGQTIRQEDVFNNHSLYNANLKVGAQFISESLRQISRAIQASILKKGPVHINIPFDEPLYKTTNQLLVEKPLFLSDSVRIAEVEYTKFASMWNREEKKLILVGTHFPDKRLENILLKLVKDNSVLIFTETISNIHHPKFINSIDKLIFPLSDDDLKELQPNILVTLGGMVVSKKIKQFLRAYQPKHHWHIDTKKAYDTYHCLTDHIQISPVLFLDNLLKHVQKGKNNYQEFGLALKRNGVIKHKQFLKNAKFSDLKVFDIVLKTIPENVQLQLGNSSIIRYTQLFDLKKSLKVFCNRGASGIDGSTSTAIGASNIENEQTVFITGDISFFYDSNALWNAYLKKDFRIIVINNGGGNIFRFIPGPQQTNALQYFETPHQFSAKNLCQMYNLEYIYVKTENELVKALEIFYNVNNKTKLLEINTLEMNNDAVLRAYFKALAIC